MKLAQSPSCRRRVTASIAATAVTLGMLTVAVLGAANAEAKDDTNPDFGPNVTIIDPSMSADQINTALQGASNETDFSLNRHAVLFKPGTYGSATGAADPSTATGMIDSPVGFYESVQGLGASPDDVTINGNLRVGTATGDALSTFWRSVENVKINPIETDETAHTMRWNTSQASPLRRVDIAGNLDLQGGRAFGNELANIRVSGDVEPGHILKADSTQTNGEAQYFIRNSQIGGWDGDGVDDVLSGVTGAPPSDFANTGMTSLPSTPVSREAPFVYLDGTHYKVFVPSAKENTSGISWGTARSDGSSIPLRDFYIAQPAATAETLNYELGQGKNILFTPGVYYLDQPIQVTRPDTVIMGMGFASLTPTAGTAAIQVGNARGVSISSLTVDANAQNSDVLVQVGTHGVHRGSAGDPTTLSDVFVRVGGPWLGRATTSVEINQNNVIIDHAWLWRADHGTGVGWTSNIADHGLVVVTREVVDGEPA